MNLLKETISFLTDKKLVVAVLFLLIFETILQLGFYKPFLKKNSYASNINRVTEHVVSKRDVLDPDILIVGTSVAFEGISVRILNERLQKSGWKTQSIAVRGSELVVQHRILEEYLQKFPNVKIILHVMEPGMPWVDRNYIVDPTLAMLSELGNFKAIPTVLDFEYNLQFPNYLYLVFKSVAYRKDLSDFVINFNERLKAISRNNKNPNTNPWDYENDHPESIDEYNLTSVDDCLNRLALNLPLDIPKASNPDHRRMLFETCGIASVVPQDSNATDDTRRYFRRLKKMYDFIGNKKIHIVNVFAPYSDVIRKVNNEGRMKVWLDGLKEALSSHQTLDQMDLQDSLGATNGKYCFDLIHLNEAGMKEFSGILADALEKKLGKR
ncbi:SGNH/GDSL hydrolase family protein [Leptospira sp. 201903075]|uniref:SGNH/GDSL hydrolase family protein n=1 Tax=Leptospira chreensis TaxID=2810035 RepID=UPI0019645E97|nr:SGNH/GDSL hydrolase family protein [Leptospira chreensis]MBM9590749.1 SGNH/GDSL hydrolase family protein [Leptospira chreensis]